MSTLQFFFGVVRICNELNSNQFVCKLVYCQIDYTFKLVSVYLYTCVRIVILNSIDAVLVYILQDIVDEGLLLARLIIILTQAGTGGGAFRFCGFESGCCLWEQKVLLTNCCCLDIRVSCGQQLPLIAAFPTVYHASLVECTSC